MAKKSRAKKKIVAIATGRQVHLSSDECDLLFLLLNTVQPKEAGGLRYVMILGDLIKAVGSGRRKTVLDGRQEFGRRFGRVREGKEGNLERRAISKELDDWLEENKVTNECFPTGSKTIPIDIPPESNTTLLNVFLHHARAQMGTSLLKVAELCDHFELRTQFLEEAVKLDEDDDKKEAEARAAANK